MPNDFKRLVNAKLDAYEKVQVKLKPNPNEDQVLQRQKTSCPQDPMVIEWFDWLIFIPNKTIEILIF